MRGHCAWSGSAASLLALDPAALAEPRLQVLAEALQTALPAQAGRERWWVALDWGLLRSGRRVDAVVASGRAVIAVQFRPGAARVSRGDLLAADDAALDLADFHPGCRGVPVLPVVLAPGCAAAGQQWPLPLAGAAPAVAVGRLGLAGLLRHVAGFPAADWDGVDWAAIRYRPVPGLIEAARALYADHAVSALRLAEAGPVGIGRARAAIADAVARARADAAKVVVFLTGAPGAGKTLCGLDLAFGAGEPAAFLTGNPSLVHVLREALVRDASARGVERRAAERRMRSVIQALPEFRDCYVGAGGAPPERVLVIDEAQRCWTAAHAVGKTRNRRVRLQDSEPGHLLDIMARRPGWAALVCLMGGGQEIHDGEGGLAAWGEALARRPAWQVWAPAAALGGTDARQVLPSLPGLTVAAGLHLAAPVRAVAAPLAAEWVAAVLAGERARAAGLAAAGGAPFAVTRSLEALRAALRPGGTRSAGLLASSTARRLRAEGLGAVLPHQDEAAVARWFLDRWPDVRSGDALEVVASEFAVQGLELDRVGVCWDGDLVRVGGGWQARRFRANRWTGAGAEATSNRVNAYRVLLTRARHGTVIWVPRGERRDPTRDPALYDGVAAYLIECGAAALDEAAGVAEDAAPLPEPILL